MLISAQEQELCSSLRDFPEECQNQWTPEAGRRFVQLLFRSLVGNNQDYLKILFNHKVPRDTQDWSLREAQGSTEGSEYTENARGKPCGHIFKSGEATYRCKTCTIDDTCVLCSRCYESSDHTDHMVFVNISPGNSGCCDCGDIEAWRRPVNCAIHSHQELSESQGKQKEPMNIPEDLAESIRMTIGRAFDYMCDVISCSPEQLRLPKSENSIKEDELSSRLAAKWYGESSTPDKDTEYALVLWNDEKHSMQEVTNQVARACKKEMSFGQEKARETDDIGRSVVTYGKDLELLLKQATIIEKIKITVTIRSARDTFREQMCSAIIEWLLDISGCAVGADGDILKQTVCKEMLKPWRAGSKASHAYIGKDGIDDHEIDESMREREMYSGRNIHDIQVQPNGGIAVTVIQRNNQGQREERDDNGEDEDDTRSREGETDDLMDLDIDLGSSDADGDLDMRTTADHEPDDDLEVSEATLAGYPPPPPPPAGRNPALPRITPASSDAIGSAQTTPKAVVPVPKTPWSHNRSAHSRPPPKYWIESLEETQPANVPLAEDIRQRVRLDWLILFDLRLWKKARVDLRDLYISTVVTVPEFKRILGLRFAGLYTVLAQLYLIADREPDHSIIYLSLQMLTTPSITLEVIEKGNFLTNLIAILYTFLTTRQVGHPGDVDASATLAFDTGSVTNRRMYHFFMDLKHLFQSEFVQEKLREDERYVLQFLDLIKLPQGICPNVRAVGEHVEYETDTWISASLLTRELNRLCRQFAEAFKWSGGENYHSICSVMRIIAKATVINSIGVERKLFDQAEIKDETRFKHMSGLGFELEAAGMSSDPEMYDIVDFAVETEPISFHHALHYILSWLVDCAKSMPPDEVRRLLTFTAEEIHDAAPFAQYRTVAPAYPPETYLMALFDFPLRVCAWLAQMKAGMWVRNGLSLRHQMSTYRGVQQRDLAHQRDIFLLQTAMVVCNPSRVLLSIIDRFGMLGWMAGNFPVRDKGENDEATQMLDVAEDFIHLLIVILIERTSLQPPEDEPSPQSLAIRRDITHILCFKPLSFSDLCNRLVDKFQDLDEFQEILEEMATFRSPEGLSDTGTFELKSEYLAEIDPYILHYTKNQRDEAEAVYRNWVSKKTGKPAADVVMEPKLRTIKSGLFQDLAAFTRTDIFAQVVLNSLRWALTAGQHSPNTQSTRVEAFLMVVLHLILAAIFEDQSNDDAYDSQSQKSFVRRILFKGSIEQDSIFLSLHSLLIRDDLSACHPKTRKILARLEQKCPQSVARVTEARGVSMVKGGADTPLTASVEELEAKKKAALDRQAKVLASFQKQQEAFLNNQNDIDWGEDEDYDESESVAMSQEEHKKFWKYPDGNCILCQEETNDNRLYGTFGLLGESRILRQTDMDDSDYLREVLDTPSSLDRSAERIRPFGVGGQNHFPVKKLASDGTEITSERQGLGKGFQALDCRAGPISVGCGHIMHFACFELYLSATSRRQAHQIARNHPEKLEMMEFVCPLCKALGNTFLPIIWKGKEESYPGVLETEVSFTEWIDSQIGLLASRYLKFPAERSGTNARQQEVFANTLASTFLAPSSGVAAVNRAATDPGPVTPLRWVFNMMPGTFPDEDGATAASSSEAYLIEELMSIYSRVKETIKKNQLRSRFPYTTYENASNVPDLVYIDILANAVGCSIAATEAAYRGVESDAGCLLLDKIPSITLTHLRILSESASSYIAMGASRAQGASRANLEFTQMQKDQLVQLFAGHPQIFEELPWGRQGDQVMRLPAALAGDPFLLLAEASVCLVPALRIDIHHVVQLCFLMELVKVILTIHCNAKIIPLLPQMSIPNNKAAEISPDSVNELRRFLDYLEICGDLNTKLSRCDVEVLRRLHLLISTYAQTFLRKAAILLNVRYGVDFPNTGYGDMDQPELARLSRAMRMPQLIEVFGIVSQDPEQGGNGNLRSIVRAWITHWRLMTRHGTGLSDAAFKGIRPSHPAIFELVGLPKYYDTLLDEMMRRRCPTTKKELMEPAICLFCGDIFCSQAVCCSVDGLGGCNQHMKKCGGNVGIFINLRKCCVLYLHNRNGSWSHAPYLDKHGEVDPGLRRSRQLILSQKRYDALLRKTWLEHGIPTVISRKLEADINNGGWETLHAERSIESSRGEKLRCSMNIAASANKPRQDKALLRSCEPCRSAKAKCVPAADPAVKECERCLKYHKNCIYAEAQPRPKRGKQTHTRVAEVEKKLDSIYALLQANRHPETTASNSTAPPSNLQIPSPVSSTEQTGRAQSPFVLQNAATQLQALTPPASDCRGDLRRRMDVIDKGVLSEQEAEELLRIYQDAGRDYPFVHIDPSTKLETLRWEKPFLLLSVLVMASPRARSLQILLEKELRELLSSKVIVEGELSLDLLQGLLVYLAWYHFNFRPCRQQLYQLTQLAASMVIDLEIARPVKEKNGFVLHPVRACLACKNDTALPIMSELEAKRTFVGAYYLTSALSAILRKPNALTYTKYVEQCCLDLAEAKEAPMDEHLIHYVSIQRIAEEVGIMFGYSDFVDEARLSPERIQLSVRAFMANLHEIEKSFSSEARAMPSIMNLYHSTASYVHEVILHVDVDKSHSPHTTPDPLQTPWLHSTTRTDLLLGCLESLKTGLSYFASLPLTSIERFTVLDLARLSYSLLLLGRLTLSSGPGFNSDVFQQSVDVIQYFDLFNARFASLVEIQGGEPQRTIYWHFQRIFGNARAWFGSRIERGKKGLVPTPADGVRPPLTDLCEVAGDGFMSGRIDIGALAGSKYGAGNAIEEAAGGKVGTQAGTGNPGRNLSPLSLLDPEEEETVCRRLQEHGLSTASIRDVLNKGRENAEGRFRAFIGTQNEDVVNGGMEGIHGANENGNRRGSAFQGPGKVEETEAVPPPPSLGPEMLVDREGNAVPVDMDMEGVMGMQEGLWEEMMAVWPMSMDGSVLF